MKPSKKLKLTDDELVNPCSECLVRACCKETCKECGLFIDKIFAIAKTTPKHDWLRKHFSETQAQLISTTSILCRELYSSQINIEALTRILKNIEYYERNEKFNR
jgi:hypothetical protein